MQETYNDILLYINSDIENEIDIFISSLDSDSHNQNTIENFLDNLSKKANEADNELTDRFNRFNDTYEGFLNKIGPSYKEPLENLFNGIGYTANAFKNPPTEVTTNGILWGDAFNGIKLNQPIKKISNFSELVDQIDNGLTTGAFQSIQVFTDGIEILEITGTKEHWKFESNDVEETITGNLPSNFGQIFSFGLARIIYNNDISEDTTVTTTPFINEIDNSFINDTVTEIENFEANYGFNLKH